MYAALLGGLLLVAAAPAAAPPPECAVDITFGSYGAGIDRKVHDRMMDYLQRAPGVAGVTEAAWGREGERRVCVVTRSDADTRRIYRRAAAMIPARTARAPTTIAALGLHRETRLARCDRFTWDKFLGRCGK